MKSIIAALFMSFCLLSQQAVAVSVGISFTNPNTVDTISQDQSSQMPCHEMNADMQDSVISGPTASHHGAEILESSTASQSQGQDCCEQDCQCCVGCGLSFISDITYRPISTIITAIDSQYFSQTPQTLPQLLFRPPITR